MPTSAKKKIMVVDDSEICREVARVALESRGYTVILHDSPFGINQLMVQHRPDLLLLDITMPGLTGDKAAEMAQKTRMHECPIVFLSDRPREELAELVRRANVAGFISKTFDLGALAESVERYLRKE